MQNPVMTIDGVTYSRDLKTLISSMPGTHKVKIPDGVEEIAPKAFYQSKIETCVMPASLVRIGDSAFDGCENLAKLELPKDLSEIGNNSFRHCCNLVIDEFPASLTNIPPLSFLGCYQLQNNLIFKNVVCIENSAFRLTGFKLLHIPGNIKTIGWDAFKQCSNLETIEIEEGTEILGIGAFCNNDKLKTVLLPSTIKETGNGFLAVCPKLESVTIKAVDPPYNPHHAGGAYLFSEDILMSVKVFVPEQSVEKYKRNPLWGKVSNILPIRK